MEKTKSPRSYLASIIILFTIITSINTTISVNNQSNYSISNVVNAQQQSQTGSVMQINDTITLTPGWVEWSEQWYSPEPHKIIEDGFWFEFHQREYLINPNDLFLELYETFNWTGINDTLWGYENFTEFEDNLAEDPLQWLSWAWDIDSLRYGISLNQTFIEAKLNGDIASVNVWCHIKQVAEYLIGWDIGIGDIFDLRSISLGKIETYEYILDSTQKGRSIYIHFSAPSTLIEEKGKLSTATIHIKVQKQLEPSEYNRQIKFMMPSTTEITVAKADPKIVDLTPEIVRNTATYNIQHGEPLPNFFTINSRIPEQTFLIILGDIRNILYICATLILVVPSSIQGFKMIRRRRTYNKLLLLMINLYKENKSNPETFRKEMDNLTESLFTSFINTKITDEQLEKLLQRRDNLLTHSQK